MPEPQPDPLAAPLVGATKSSTLLEQEARYAAWAQRMKDRTPDNGGLGREHVAAEPEIETAPGAGVVVGDAFAADVFDMDLLFTSSAKIREDEKAGEGPTPSDQRT